MATITKMDSTLTMVYSAGLNEKGKDILKKESFGRVKAEASIDDVYAVANAIGTLMLHPLKDVVKQDKSKLFAE